MKKKATPEPKGGRPADPGEKWWRSSRVQAMGFVLMLVGFGALLGGLRRLTSDDTAQLQARAEALGRDGDWAGALEIWRSLNARPNASAATYLGEGKACLGLGRAAQAERALRQAIAARPDEAEPYLLLLEIFSVEDRQLDAFTLGWQALEELPPESRIEILRELSLTILADLPDDVARTTLERWFKADRDDIDARIAYLRRVAAEPRADDPDRESRLAELTAIVERRPEHIGAREALVSALADAGEPERGELLLDAWPSDQRDGRYWRLKGRWDLEHDHRPDQAVAAFERALVDFPQDWRTHYRLARALQNSGQTERARLEADTVARIRELLDPMTLAPRLDAAFAHLDDPTAFKTLANLCERAGRTRLAEAWRSAEAHRPEPHPAGKVDGRPMP